MKNKLMLFIFSLSIFGMLHAQETGTIEGTVRLAENNKSLDMVAVFLDKTEKGNSTDDEGHYIIENVPVGDYVIIASDIRTKPSRREVQVRADEIVTVDFDMEWTFADLDAVVIKGGVTREKNKSVPVNTITSSQIKAMNISITSDLLNSVPGVVVGSGALNGGISDGFAIRGYGEDAMHAAVNLDGIPLNEYAGHGADGQVDMYVMIPLEIKSMDVYKGPTSVLFGRFAEGGAVSFETRRGGDYMDFDLTGGSFAKADFQAAIGKPINLGDEKQLGMNMAAQIYNTEGYTDNGDVLRGNLATKFSYDLTKKTAITLSLRGHSSRWNTDSYVEENQFKDRLLRRQPYKHTENDGGQKLFTSERLDINHTINENIRLLTFVNAVYEKGNRYFSRSFRGNGSSGQQSDEFNQRNAILAGGNLNGKSFLGDTEVNWVFGGEYYLTKSERDQDNSVSYRQRISAADYENIYGKTPRKPIHSKFTHSTISLFTEGIFEINRYFRPAIGIRYDTYFIKYRNRLTDEVFQLNSYDHISPKLGISSNVLDDLTLRINVSHGFNIPTSQRIEAYLNSENKPDPSKIWQYEVGGKYDFNGILSFDASAFILDENNIGYENANGDFFNAGKIRRQGIELGTMIDPLPRLHLEGSFSYIKTEIKDNPDLDMVGNEIIAVPHTIARGVIDYHLLAGPGVQFEIRDIGKSAVNESNSVFYNGYTVVNTEVYYSFKSKNKNSRLFVQVNNLFNELYSTRTVNFGGANFYAPAPTRNIMAGIKYSF